MNPSTPSLAGCVAYFTPGHLQAGVGRARAAKHRNYVTTHVSFSPNGEEMLQNLGGENIFMYNINNGRKPLVFSMDDLSHSCGLESPTSLNHKNKQNHSNDTGTTSGVGRREKSSESLYSTETNELPEIAFQLKKEGNEAFSDNNYFQAVICYSKAIAEVPNSSVLYANRAAALLKRNW